MTERVGKRFSNVRYWRYVFTPMILIVMIFGLFIMYTADASMTSSFNSVTGAYRRANGSNLSMNARR
jgi:hypothetical protein